MKTAVLQIYMDANEEWRWRLKSPNGRIIADSAEGFTNKRGAARSAKLLVRVFDGLVKLKVPS